MIAFLFGTVWGRALLIAACIGLSWWVFSSHYEAVGYEKCQDDRAKALAAANAETAEKNAERDRESGEVGREAAEAADEVSRDVEAGAAGTKEIIDDVYDKPPTTAPVALGSCVYPLDQRVQDSLDAAVRRANAPGGAVQATRRP